MHKKAGLALILTGAVLISSALLLLFHNRQQSQRAGREAELLLYDLQAVLESQSPEPESEPLESDIPEHMPIVEIDGYGYIGYLSIPAIELELPVMSVWDYTRLEIAPCRQFGSTRDNSLIIAAHNYESHFGSLHELEVGDKVCFTEMDGRKNEYLLAKLEALDPEESEKVLESEYDLVLYTCTPGGAMRVVAFCERIQEENN